VRRLRDSLRGRHRKDEPMPEQTGPEPGDPGPAPEPLAEPSHGETTPDEGGEPDGTDPGVAG
jgi:hypothetical protein